MTKLLVEDAEHESLVQSCIQGQFLQMEFISFLAGFAICEFLMKTIAIRKCVSAKDNSYCCAKI